MPCIMYIMLLTPIFCFIFHSFGGFPEAAVGNIFQAVQCAARYPSCVGLLVTDWAGHLFTNQPTISWPAFVTAAGISWNHTMNLVRIFCGWMVVVGMQSELNLNNIAPRCLSHSQCSFWVMSHRKPFKKNLHNIKMWVRYRNVAQTFSYNIFHHI